jgi:hypothetical protein
VENADVLRRLGVVALIRSKFEEAREKLAESLPLYEDFIDRLAKARSIFSLGVVRPQPASTHTSTAPGME